MVPASCSTKTKVSTPAMSSTVDQLIWLTAPFCFCAENMARTTATLIETKPMSRSKPSARTASTARPISVRICSKVTFCGASGCGSPAPPPTAGARAGPRPRGAGAAPPPRAAVTADRRAVPVPVRGVDLLAHVLGDRHLAADELAPAEDGEQDQG